MITCPNCKTPIPMEHINTGQLHPCPGCGASLGVEAFNALFKEDKKDFPGEENLVDHPTACFYHPGKKGVVPCDACGRMLCSLCQVEINNRKLCMNCLKIGREKQKIATLKESQVLYDGMAMALAAWPLFMFFLTLVTAPAAIYFAIRHLRTPSLVLPKKYLKSIAALLLASAQIAGWGIFFVNLWM